MGELDQLIEDYVLMGETELFAIIGQEAPGDSTLGAFGDGARRGREWFESKENKIRRTVCGHYAAVAFRGDGLHGGDVATSARILLSVLMTAAGAEKPELYLVAVAVLVAKMGLKSWCKGSE